MKRDFWFSESGSAVFTQAKLQLILGSNRLCKDAKLLEGEGERKGKESFN